MQRRGGKRACRPAPLRTPPPPRNAAQDKWCSIHGSIGTIRAISAGFARMRERLVCRPAASVHHVCGCDGRLPYAHVRCRRLGWRVGDAGRQGGIRARDDQRPLRRRPNQRPLRQRAHLPRPKSAVAGSSRTSLSGHRASCTVRAAAAAPAARSHACTRTVGPSFALGKRHPALLSPASNAARLGACLPAGRVPPGQAGHLPDELVRGAARR